VKENDRERERKRERERGGGVVSGHRGNIHLYLFISFRFESCELSIVRIDFNEPVRSCHRQRNKWSLFPR